MAIAASIIGALVAAAAGAALSAATRPKIPGAPDYSQATRAGIEADIATLPARRAIEAAARLGQKISIPTGRTVPGPPQIQTFATLPGGQEILYNPADFAAGGQYAGLSPNLIQRQIATTKPEIIEADFTGRGDAATQAELARIQAQTGLDLSKKYGSQFIEAARAQEQLADPEGWAARQKLYSLIMQQANAKPERPVANLLQSQILDELNRGKGLDTGAQAQLAAVQRDRAGLGDVSDADVQGALESGLEGQQRLDTRSQRALGWLASGATPEDVEYRRKQQTLANEAAFLRGETPTAQFGQLSGAQTGATPLRGGPGLPGLNPNAGAQYAGAVAQNYGITTGNAGRQVNPWLGGLSLALQGASAAGRAGAFRPT